MCVHFFAVRVACFFFLLFGRGACSFLLFGRGRVLFLLFGRGRVFFFCLGRGRVFFCRLGGGREFTHLPVCLARLQATQQQKRPNSKKKHGFHTVYITKHFLDPTPHKAFRHTTRNKSIEQLKLQGMKKVSGVFIRTNMRPTIAHQLHIGNAGPICIFRRAKQAQRFIDHHVSNLRIMVQNFRNQQHVKLCVTAISVGDLRVRPENRD